MDYDISEEDLDCSCEVTTSQRRVPAYLSGRGWANPEQSSSAARKTKVGKCGSEPKGRWPSTDARIQCSTRAVAIGTYWESSSRSGRIGETSSSPSSIRQVRAANHKAVSAGGSPQGKWGKARTPYPVWTSSRCDGDCELWRWVLTHKVAAWERDAAQGQFSLQWGSLYSRHIDWCSNYRVWERGWVWRTTNLLWQCKCSKEVKP